MNTQEHLNRIKAKCEQLLAIAEKRTAGEWIHATDIGQVGSIECGIEVIAMTQEHVCLAGKHRDQIERRNHNATFIASCAGAAEAGWRATVAAIDSVLIIIEFFASPLESPLHQRELEIALDTANAIIAAWPQELL